MHTISSGLVVATAALLVISALHDTAFRTVPNSVSICLALCGIALHTERGDLQAAFLAALIVFTAAAFCWRRGWMGGGDVKLLAAAAFVAAPAQVPLMIAWTGMAGGLLSIPYLIGRARPMAHRPSRPQLFLARIVRAERWRLHRGGPLPYAVAIAAGAGVTLLQGVPS
jgi:prepilin peptidase CpaA